MVKKKVVFIQAFLYEIQTINSMLKKTQHLSLIRFSSQWDHLNCISQSKTSILPIYSFTIFCQSLHVSVSSSSHLSPPHANPTLPIRCAIPSHLFCLKGVFFGPSPQDPLTKCDHPSRYVNSVIGSFIWTKCDGTGKLIQRLSLVLTLFCDALNPLPFFSSLVCYRVVYDTSVDGSNRGNTAGLGCQCIHYARALSLCVCVSFASESQLLRAQSALGECALVRWKQWWPVTGTREKPANKTIHQYVTTEELQTHLETCHSYLLSDFQLKHWGVSPKKAV